MLVYTTNVTQSTTQNAYGVYDMNGCSWECAASYVDNKHENITNYGGDMATNRTSNKYCTVYKSNNTTGSLDAKYETEDYELNKGMKGDAIYETSSGVTGINSWWSSDSYFPYRSVQFFVRGGHLMQKDGSGVFGLSKIYGASRKFV